FTADDDGTALIVMEFIHGKTLEELLKTAGPPPLGLALEIAQQSLRALGYLHTKGFIHRDISPDNLMLTEDTDGDALIKLIDLGIAKILGGGDGGQHTATGMYLGKVRYSSPEQFGFEGAQPMDARGDLYSFGIVLYELLTGRYPILGRDSSSLIAGHLFRPPLDFTEADPEGRVPAGLRAVVLSALAKSPDERPQSAQEFSRALGAFRAHGDLHRRDLKRALSRHSGGTGKLPVISGTTQERLDEHFELGPTPRPQTLTPVPPLQIVPPPLQPLQIVPPPGDAEIRQAAEAERQRSRELAAAIAEIQSALARGDYRSAETQLFGAEANFGQQEVFPALYERVAELRRGEVDGKVAAHGDPARRRAEAGDWDGARAELKRAQRLDADSAELA